MKGLSLVSMLLVASTALSALAEAQEASLLGEGRGIDHVIVYVRDLETAEDVYRDALGFIVGESYALPTGYKASWVGFDRNWLELRAIDDPEKVAQATPWASVEDRLRVLQFLENRDGALALVLNSSSVETTTDFLQRRGFDVPESHLMVFDDTVSLYFTLNESVLPGPRVTFAELWPAYEANFRHTEPPEWARHPNTARWITSVWIAVSDLETATKAYEAIGLDAGRKVELPELGASGREMKVGPLTVLLLQPGIEGGKVFAFLADRGEGIMGVSMEVRDLETARKVIESNTGLVFAPYAGPYGSSILIPAQIAQGLWIEMFQK